MQVILDLSLSNERLEVSRSRTSKSLLRGLHVNKVPSQAFHHDENLLLSQTPGMLAVQKENARLKQHVLDLRRAARACGCDLNATEADAAAAYPELGEVLGLPTGEAASLAPAPDHGQIHRPERHR